MIAWLWWYLQYALTSCGAGTRIFQDNLVSTMAADALTLIAASSLTTMIKKDSNHLHCLKFEKW